LTTLRIAVAADLHWGHRHGQDATRALADFVLAESPDVFLLAGDVGTGSLFEDCLRLFAEMPGVKALVPGNHDLWVSPDNKDFDSLDLYLRLLPEAAARQGFHYLDSGPLLLPGDGLAIVGTVNWYDYSWSIDAIRRLFPEEEHRLQSKRFPRGRHNDANFIRWPLDDAGFTSLVTATLERHLEQASAQAERLIVVAHHPPFYAVSFPRSEPPTQLEGLMWDAFAGNVGVEQLLARHASKISHVFCGHTHRARHGTLGPIQGYNVGSDYPFKRLLLLDWPGGEVQEHQFGTA
jgi:predicted phosphohydrolase